MTLRIDEPIVATNDGVEVRQRKTRGSVWTVAVTESTVEVLQALRSRCGDLEAVGGFSGPREVCLSPITPGDTVLAW